MKTKQLKSICCLLTLALALLLLPQKALAVSASFTGDSTVSPGGSVTLTLSVSGDIYGLSGTLETGSGLTFSSYTCADSKLTLTVNGNNFSAYGTTATSGKIITVTLKADSGAAGGAALSASFKNIIVSDGEKDTELGTASWSGTVAAKPSSVCHLTAIRCANATLSPAFNKDTTYYTANVPYSVEKLSLDYDRADKSSTVTVSGTALAVGANTITVKCTAADGTSKTYTLSVTRQQDPNYKPSDDATLKALKLDAGTLSPAFSPDITEYVAYVPYETEEVTLIGTAGSEKATTSGESTVRLTGEGAVPVTVKCTAEDGKTTATYTVQVFRMPKFEGVLPLVELPATGTDIATQTDVEEAAPDMLQLPARVKLPLIGEASTLLVSSIAAGLIVVLLFLLGFLIGRGRRDDREEDDGDDGDNRPFIPPTPPIPQAEAPEKPAPPAVPPEEPKTEAPTDAGAEEESVAAAAAHMSLDELLRDIRNM